MPTNTTIARDGEGEPDPSAGSFTTAREVALDYYGFTFAEYYAGTGSHEYHDELQRYLASLSSADLRRRDPATEPRQTPTAAPGSKLRECVDMIEVIRCEITGYDPLWETSPLSIVDIPDELYVRLVAADPLWVAP